MPQAIIGAVHNEDLPDKDGNVKIISLKEASKHSSVIYPMMGNSVIGLEESIQTWN